MKKVCLAIDIGASSGRHIVGWQNGEDIETCEVYRFKNGMEEGCSGLIWDHNALFSNVLEGIKRAFLEYDVVSLSIDTWGVDYGLIDHNGELIPPVYAYRNSRTIRAKDDVHNIISAAELYKKTGLQYQPYNTIYQLYSDKLEGRLSGAKCMLMIPTLLSYWLTGVVVNEYTNAKTTGLIDVETGSVSRDIMERLGIQNIITDIRNAGYVLGRLLPDIAEKVGGQTAVMLCATHDTASAVVGAEVNEGQLYLSSGTWSILGVEVERAVNSEEARRYGLSNEGGLNGKTRLQKNLMGMWVVNNLMHEHPEIPDPDTGMYMARDSGFCYIVDINDESLLAPKSMSEAIRALAIKSGHPEPKNFAELMAVALHSLAYGYAETIKSLEDITQTTYNSVVVVGGGARSLYLNELTAKYSGKQVIARPKEATSIGNLKIQLKNQYKWSKL